MLQRFTPPIRGMILDADGVLWKDASPIGDLPLIFARMDNLRLKVCLATNNATMTVEQYLAKLAGFGVKLGPDQVVTSAHGTAAALTKAFPERGAVFVVGEIGLISAVCEAGFTAVSDPKDERPVVAAVVGFDRALTYQKLVRAMWHIKAGARFYGTNPDATFPTPAGLVPGAGAIIAACLQKLATSRRQLRGSPPGDFIAGIQSVHRGCMAMSRFRLGVGLKPLLQTAIGANLVRGKAPSRRGQFPTELRVDPQDLCRTCGVVKKFAQELHVDRRPQAHSGYLSVWKPERIFR